MGNEFGQRLCWTETHKTLVPAIPEVYSFSKEKIFRLFCWQITQVALHRSDDRLLSSPNGRGSLSHITRSFKWLLLGYFGLGLAMHIISALHTLLWVIYQADSGADLYHSVWKILCTSDALKLCALFSISVWICHAQLCKVTSLPSSGSLKRCLWRAFWELWSSPVSVVQRKRTE